MVKRLELEALEADLAAVEELLSDRTEADDPSGWVQYSRRKLEIEREIEAFGARPSSAAELPFSSVGAPYLEVVPSPRIFHRGL